MKKSTPHCSFKLSHMHFWNPALHLINFLSDSISSLNRSFKASRLSGSVVAVFSNGYSLRPSMPVPSSSIDDLLQSSPDASAFLFSELSLIMSVPKSYRLSSSLGSLLSEPIDNVKKGDRAADEVLQNRDCGTAGRESLFLAKLAIALGVAAALTFISFGLKGASFGSLLGVQHLAEGSSSSIMDSSVGFTFKAFGYRFILPEYAPGWIYFWLLIAAGCGLFISEEALNIWVGITLARMLSLDGTWHSFVESLSRNASYIVSTVLWVYWGVCISNMIPFYLGKLFRQSGASDDVCSKLGIGEEKVLQITRAVQKYGSLMGFIERFSLGFRNPTAFLAGSLVSIYLYFSLHGVQLGIGFLMRKHPVFTLATVATVVRIWTVFPYVVAASTALFLYLWHCYST